MKRVYNRYVPAFAVYMTPTQVTQATGISRSTLYRYIAAGSLKPVYIKRSSGTIAMRFTTEEVQRVFTAKTAIEMIAEAKRTRSGV